MRGFLLPALPVMVMLAACPGLAQNSGSTDPTAKAQAPRPAARPAPEAPGASVYSLPPSGPADEPPGRFALPEQPAPEPANPPKARPETRTNPSASPEAAPEPGSQPLPAESGPEPSAPPAWQALTEDDFSYQACLLGLSMLGVGYQQVAPVSSGDNPDCGIARPLRIDEIQPGVVLHGGPLMRCDLARKLALWLRHEAQPAIRHLPGAPRIVAIQPGSTYQCRARVGTAGERLSEHALGNAFDVMAFELSDGGVLPIQPREDTGAIEEAVQKALHHGACLYFTTVLGPGSNAAHDDHLHLDIAARKGGWRLCE